MKEYAKEGAVKILIGTKKDLVREVLKKASEDYSHCKDFDNYYEISALHDHDIKAVFIDIVALLDFKSHVDFPEEEGEFDDENHD